jgi:hypothetical protein
MKLYQIMDVAFADNIRRPRRLILEVNPKSPSCLYTTCSEDGFGTGHNSCLMSLDEWLRWIESFRDELTGKEIRDAIEAAKAPFVEPQGWVEFRTRYQETGNPWIK